MNALSANALSIYWENEKIMIFEPLISFFFEISRDKGQASQNSSQMQTILCTIADDLTRIDDSSK